jgi:hypothetical protein
LLKRAKNGMSFSWAEHIFEALTMIEYGFAPVAIQYKRDEQGSSDILWDRFMLMGQDTVLRWNIDEYSNILGMFQYPHIYPQEIPIDRMLLFRVNVERNSPEGRSMLRTAFPSYYYASELSKIEAIGKERGMVGIPVIMLPEIADKNESDPNSDVNMAHKAVRNIRTDEQAGMVLPFGWDMKLLTTGLNSELAMNAVIQRYEARMLMATLAQSLMVSMSGTATSGKAGDTDLFTIVIDAIADLIADVHTKQSIPRLMEMNGMEWDGLRLEHSPPGDVNFVELAQSLAMLGDKVTWTPEDEVQTRAIMRLPKIDTVVLAGLREEAKAELEQDLQEKQIDEQSKIDDRTTDGIKPQKPTLKSGTTTKKTSTTTTNPNNPKNRGKYEAEVGLQEMANPPDEPTRTEHERSWLRSIAGYFNRATKRVLVGADES